MRLRWRGSCGEEVAKKDDALHALVGNTNKACHLARLDVRNHPFRVPPTFKCRLLLMPMLHSLRDVPLLKSARLGIALAILLAACSGGAKSTALPATSTDNAPTKAVAEEWVLDDAEESMVLGSDMGTRVKFLLFR
jgi:hypothetical protein